MKKLNDKTKILIVILAEVGLLVLVHLTCGLTLDFLMNVAAGYLGIYILDDFLHGNKRQKRRNEKP